jgi:3-deoxy-D-manno-octulosonate 8-phosphate phosphatase KdsC-like HAD superfamily phosphatase
MNDCKVMDFHKIKMVVFDFNGIFTDNYVYVNEGGQEMIRCCCSNELGLSKLKQMNIESFVISTERNPVNPTIHLKRPIS